MAEDVPASAMAEGLPASAMAEDKLGKAFRPAKFEFSKVHFNGGLLRRPMPLTTRKVTDRNGAKIFVKMSASEPWLIGARTEVSRDALPHYTLDHVAQLCG